MTNQTILTSDDILFLNKLRSRNKSSMEFTILRIEPVEEDLVLFQSEPPLHLRKRIKNMLVHNFISIGEIARLCENAASNNMIYEAWLDSALDNVYMVSRSLCPADKDRLIAYFKNYHEIENEEDLRNMATEAINEAMEAMYG